MRLANDICAAAMEHVRGEMRPGMKESEVAAIWLGFVHGQGTGWEDKVELALGFSLIWSGRGSRRSRRPATSRSTRARRRCSRSGSARTGTGPTTRNTALPRRVAGRLPRARGRSARRLRRARSRIASRARASQSSTGSCATAIDATRLPRSTVASDLPTASAPAPTSRRTRTRPATARSPRAWSSRSSRAATGKAAAACASRTISSITEEGAEKLSPFPDGVVYV